MRVYVTSAVVGELAVGSVTASATGQLSTVVRIPVSAKGFTPPGETNGLTFVHALGTGTAGNHVDASAMIILVPRSSPCGTVETLPFNGFAPPVANPPAVNSVTPGATVTVAFSIPGSNGTVDTVLASGYPQSVPVTCTAPGTPTTGDPTVSGGPASPTPGDSYSYPWSTDGAWRGCRALIVKLVDGTYHHAVFDFGQ